MCAITASSGAAAKAHREQLRASILAAEAQGERDGFLSIDDVMRDADALLAEMAASRR